MAATVRRESGGGSREAGEEFRSQNSEARIQEGQVQSQKLRAESSREVAVDSNGSIQDPQFQIANRTEPIQNPKSKIQSNAVESRKLKVQSAEAEQRDSQLATRDSTPGDCQLPTADCQLTFKTLGYVEKAGGQVEAVVEEAGQIYIVHAGETFADKFKVLTISRDEVQVADVRDSGLGIRDSGVRRAENRSQESGFRIQETTVESRELRPEGRAAGLRDSRLATRGSGSVVPNCQLSTVSCGLVSADSAPQLGYVKRSNGRVETIVADGEHVRLVRGEPTLLAGLVTRDSGLVTRDSKEEARSQKPEARGDVESRELKVESPLAVAIAPPTRTPKVGDPIQAEFGLPDPLQPEELAHYDRNPNRLLSLKDDLHPQAESVTNQTADELGETGSGELPLQPPEISDTSGSGPPIPHQIGYIERTMGQAEAIVAVGGEVHFVREGDVFADRFRALSVSPSWVEIEELPLEAKTSPEVALGLGPNLPGAPGPGGLSSHSPPVRDAAKLSEPEFSTGPGPPGQRPPPRAAPKGFVPAAARASPRAGPVDAGLGPPGERITLQPIGFAVRGDGETVAFVAVEGEVFLVREGETFASRYKVLRVTATAVEIIPESHLRGSEVARRPFDSLAGKPIAPTASKDNGLISLDSTTTAKIGMPDSAGTTASTVALGEGEGSLSGHGRSEGGLHSQAGMLDNSNTRR